MAQDRPIVYTDGSCIGNPGPGGWGVHAEFPDGRVGELGGGEVETTNNRMELRAAIEAVRLTAASPAVTIITDSQYVRNGVTKWVGGWKKNGWLTKAARPVENQPLWMELDALADERVTWEWTRGHVGNIGNERCDLIARWFSESIRALDLSSRRAPAGSSRRQQAPGVRYLSLVDGILARHPTWADCERRVHGVRGARYKKVTSDEQERETVARWGLLADALEYL